jgi:hypothetical protein
MQKAHFLVGISIILVSSLCFLVSFTDILVSFQLFLVNDKNLFSFLHKKISLICVKFQNDQLTISFNVTLGLSIVC